mgnify:CR=1 FL=1
MSEKLLEVEDLEVSFATEDGLVRAVGGVSFTLSRGETVAIVGESGSGKSVTVMTLMGLTRSPNSRFAGAARLHGVDLIGASEDKLEAIRGKEIAMIFQDPISALSPVYRVGAQIAEQIRAHEKISKAAALERAVDLMGRVGIPNARQRARAYPHEFSGGMRQRVMIAMALSLSPSVLIADEPTTALDVTIQAQILALLAELRSKFGLAMLFISHDLAVVSQVADRVAVMYAGSIVELGSKHEIFHAPAHPYTRGLLHSVPDLKTNRSQPLGTIEGTVPPLHSLPPGCAFEPRCGFRVAECARVFPALEEVAPAHWARCPVVNPKYK